MSFTLAKKATDRAATGELLKRAISYANTFGNSSGQKSSRQLGLSGKRSRLLARTTFQTTDGKDYSYEQFEHAYRTAYSSFLKNPGKKFGEVEGSVAVEYELGKPDSALPWDTVRPAVSSVWDRMSGVIGPRDPDRGVRGSI